MHTDGVTYLEADGRRDMSKKISSNPSVVKIADAARILGVHKDTLRRWEKSGKIQVKRDQKGTRLYDISDLVKIIPGDEATTAPPVETSYPPTGDLLKSAQAAFKKLLHPQEVITQPRVVLDQTISEDNKRISKNWRLFAGFCVFVFLSVTGVALYLRATHIPYSKPSVPQKDLSQNEVLGETTAQATVRINANEKVTGSLTVDSDINGMKLAVSPVSGEGFLISANEATISASGSINLNQDVSTTASPTFAGLNVPSLTSAALNLTSTSKQLVFQSGGPSGTLTWTPTVTRTITLPDSSDTLVGKATTDTLSNKTIKAGDSNTISGSFTGITGLGTVTTGTWNGTKISTSYGGTNLTSYTTGDILYASASDTLSKLTIGSSGQVLKISSGLPAWGAASACTNCLVTDPSSTQTITPTSSSAIGLSIAQASGGTVDIFDVTNNGGTAKYFSVNSSGNVGIGTSAAGAALQVNGGGLFGWGTTSTAGPANGLAVSGNVGLGTTSPSVMLDVRGSTIIAPSSSGVALRLNAAPSGSNNIFEVLNNVGTSTYFSVDSSGQLTGSAFQITDANNAIVGTAIAGGWTMNSNTFTYRRTITVTNSSGSTMPKYYEISITMNNSDSNQTYSKSQQSSPYKDFRTAWYNDGGTITEIARNVSSFTSSDVTFTFQLSAGITTGNSDTYYIYYGNSSLATTPSTYTGNTQLDSADTVANWTSGDDGYVLSQETTIKQEGTGSVKAVAAIGNLGTGTTASQGQLLQTLTGLSAVKATISSTDYAYVLGGNNGTSDQTTVYKSTLSSGNIGTFSTASQGQLPQALSGQATAAIVRSSGTPYALQINGGSSNYMSSSDISITGSFSLEAWIKPSSLSSETGIISKGLDIGGHVNYVLWSETNGEIKFAFNGSSCSAGSWFSLTTSGAGIQTGSWYHIVGVHDNSAGTMTIYVNGTSKGNSTGVSSGHCNNGEIFRVGADYSNASFNGLIDEVRVYNKALSSSEVTTNYSNGNGRYGSAEANLAAGWHLDEGSGTTATDYSGNSYTLSQVGTIAWGSGLVTNNIQNIYALGGLNGSTAQSTVYKSTIDGSANLGTFSTTNQTQLPQALYGHSASPFTISSSDYIYLFGGHNGTSAQTTVYKATINSSGDISAISTTSQTQLSSALYQHGSTTATIGGTNYIYILGGLNSSGTAQTTVYKATVDGSANVSAITSTGQGALPVALSQLQAVVVTTGSDNYIYAIGGKDSSGNAVSTVYKAALDSSGNVGSWSATGQGALPQALYGHGALTASSGGTNYVYVLGGQNTAVRDTVYRATVNDMSSYTATKTLSSTNLTNKNDLQWKYYSSATGSYMALEFSEDGSTWQTCSFSVSSASTWETKTCDISGIASASKDGVTKVRFRVTSNQTSAVTSYFDDIQAVTEYTSYTNTTSYGRSILGASNLAVNAQGTGLVQINYAAAPASAAGSGGFAVFDGTTNPFFLINSSGNVGIGATGPAKLTILGNVGIGYTGANQLSPSNGLAVSGNVGIGTTTANSNLSIAGNAHIGGLYQGIAAPANGLFVDGNVGIGATTSSNKLDVWGGAGITGNVGVGSSLTVTGLGVLSGGLNVSGLSNLTGNVGIGKSLTVTSNALFSGGITMGTNQSLTINEDSFQDLTGTNLTVSSGALSVVANPTFSTSVTTPSLILTGNNTALSFTGTTPSLTSGSAVFGLFAGGNVGIGTTGNLYGGLTVRGTGTGGDITLQTYGSNLTQGLTVLDNGNVGIGTTSPTKLLQIQGSGSMPSLLVTSGGNVGIGTSVTSNPLTVGIDGSSGNGAYLTTGGVWTNGSSVEFKENFVSLNDVEILDKINQLPILQWNYKLEDVSIKHIGPMAEDFYAIFGVGNDSKHISTIDPAGVALAGIKALTAQQASMSAILANLSVSDDGTLNVPRLKAGSIILDPSIASVSSQLTINNEQLTINNDPNYISPGPNLANSTSSFIDLSGKIASLEERIAEIENKLASQGDALEAQQATPSAQIAGETTSSATLSTSEESPSSPPSEVSIASSSAQNTSGVGFDSPEVSELNLTPPDILLATGSATLANLKVTSEATVSGMLTVYEEIIQQTFKSLGQTLLGKTNIAGDLSVDGTLSLTGSSLSTLGTLHIQNSLLAGDVDFFNGLVTITSDGQITAQKIQSDKLILGGGVLGSNTIKTGTDEVMVETPAVSEKSKIFVTAQTEIEIPLFVTDKIIGKSFMVKTKVPALSNIIFDWSILDSP